jgi:hypothetical protein
MKNKENKHFYKFLKASLKKMSVALAFVPILIFIIPAILIVMVLFDKENCILGVMMAMTRSEISKKRKISLKINNQGRKTDLTFSIESNPMF